MYLAGYAIHKIFEIDLEKLGLIDFAKVTMVEDESVLIDFSQAVQKSLDISNFSISFYMSLFEDLKLIQIVNGYTKLSDEVTQFAIVKKGNKKKIHFFSNKFHLFCSLLVNKLNNEIDNVVKY